MSVPARTAERLSSGLKRFTPILASAKSRDVNESDTSMIVTDMLADVFGYDKYSESRASSRSAGRTATSPRASTASSRCSSR